MAKAVELLAMPKSDEPIGELDGYPVYAKNGRYGPYVQWGDHDEPPPGLEKPKMSSLFATMVLERRSRWTTPRSCSSCRARSATTRPTARRSYANNGRYGPYVVKDKDYRSIDSEEQLLTITLEQASKIFSEPKVFKRGGRNMAAKGPLREFGTDPVSDRPVVAKDGRFGVYVTDGETNASIGKGDRIEEMTPARAYELLAIRRAMSWRPRAARPRSGRRRRRRRVRSGQRRRRPQPSVPPTEPSPRHGRSCPSGAGAVVRAIPCHRSGWFTYYCERQRVQTQSDGGSRR